jgi:hypothetical protein
MHLTSKIPGYHSMACMVLRSDPLKWQGHGSKVVQGKEGHQELVSLSLCTRGARRYGCQRGSNSHVTCVDTPLMLCCVCADIREYIRLSLPYPHAIPHPHPLRQSTRPLLFGHGMQARVSWKQTSAMQKAAQV